jgi:lysophospholipid acyltransferase (LPLAT)-like uncharacterized protein
MDSYAEVDRRRSKASRRRMTRGRRLAFSVGIPLLKALLFLLYSSYRVEKIRGADVEERILADRGRVYAPCFWHQQMIIGARLIRRWARHGFKACYIISASVDGEIAARVARSWGAEVIRGSATSAGALVLRDAHEMMRRGISMATAPDGPLGPRFRFATGAVLIARIGRAPLVPIACAADRAWYLRRSWDHFMIPKPFARIALAIGEPVEVPPELSRAELEKFRARMQAELDALVEECKARLGVPREAPTG